MSRSPILKRSKYESLIQILVHRQRFQLLTLMQICWVQNILRGTFLVILGRNLQILSDSLKRNCCYFCSFFFWCWKVKITLGG